MGQSQGNFMSMHTSLDVQYMRANSLSHNTAKHTFTANTIVSWPNPEQEEMIHIAEL